jgi:hypothetical protein
LNNLFRRASVMRIVSAWWSSRRGWINRNRPDPSSPSLRKCPAATAFPRSCVRNSVSCAIEQPRNPLPSRANLVSCPAMSYIMVDIESDGPIPGDYSMVCFEKSHPVWDKVESSRIKPNQVEYDRLSAAFCKISVPNRQDLGLRNFKWSYPEIQTV